MDEEDEKYIVLNVEGNDSTTKPYYMEGSVNGNRFKTIVDTGSPVAIYVVDDIKEIKKKERTYQYAKR